jgi:NADH dehydrogenase FAD-containing subunit
MFHFQILKQIESVIDKNKVNFINAEVTKIDRNAKKVETTHGIFFSVSINFSYFCIDEVDFIFVNYTFNWIN